MTEDQKFKVILSYTGNLGGKSALVSLSQKPDNGSFIPASYMVEGESNPKLASDLHTCTVACVPPISTHIQSQNE